MNGKQIRHTQEFRNEAIKLVTEHGYSQAEASRRLGINSKNLSRWIKESNGCKKSLLPIKDRSTLDQEELQHLRKEVKRLRLEREILKKAAAFFANESN